MKTIEADKRLQDEIASTRDELTIANEHLGRLKIRCSELEDELTNRDTLIALVKHQLERRGIMIPELGPTVLSARLKQRKRKASDDEDGYTTT